MIKLIGILVVLSFSSTAFAMETGCPAKAAEKKLAGAAKTSFIKKCEHETMAACDAMAAEKKLAGAAKTSFGKKCMMEPKDAPKG
ncbi:MAG: hypothetical protein ABI589_12300 [Burkholderiales bacterium]